MEAMKLVDPVRHRVRKRILLRIDTAGLDGFDKFRQVHGLRLRAQKLERACLHLARPHAHSHPLHVGRRANWPQAIGEMSESGLEVPEDAVVHPRFELCGQHLPEATVDRGTLSLKYPLDWYPSVNTTSSTNQSMSSSR